MSIRKVLITGSSGMIGTALCEHLLARGCEVVGVDRVPNRWSPAVQAVTRVGDLLRDAIYEELPGDADLVVHLAANSRVYNLVENPLLARDNFEVTFRVFEHARTNGIPRVVFASSREVYGNSGRETYSENDAYVRNCESPYTASKIGGEALLHSYNTCYQTRYVILRLSNVYGRYDESDRVLPQFIRQCRDKKHLQVFGADKLLDFTYLDDAVRGIGLVIDAFDRVHGNVINIASGEGTSIVEVARLVRAAMGASVTIETRPTRAGEIVKFIADISKARELLGYAPSTFAAEGVERSVAWYRRHT